MVDYPNRTLVQKYLITSLMVARKRKRKGLMSNETVAAILNAYIQADGRLAQMVVPDELARTACLDAIQRWGPKLLPSELRATVLARRHGRPRPAQTVTEHDHDLLGRVMTLELRMQALQNGVRPVRSWPTGKTVRRATVRRLRFLFTGKHD